MIGETGPEFRVGIGTDIHHVVEGRKLMLGGIHVPYPAGLLGHSDGDVAIHAVIDALLGAAGMGDIGTFFPDTDEQWKGADSKQLLVLVRKHLEEKHWQVVNVDVTIHCEMPRLESFKGQMKRSISGLLEVGFEDVNVKAKTNEGIGTIGRGRAMAATATALIKKKQRRGL